MKATLSDEKSPPDPHDEEAAEARSAEEVAREIGAGQSPSGQPAVDDEALRDSGKLKLDKSGALAGRPKLKPKRAHRRADEAYEEAIEAADAQSEEPRRARKASLPPRIGALRPEGFEAPAAPAEEEDDEVAIEGGTFLYGDQRKAVEVPGFRIDRYPVTNAEYERFVQATDHRPPLYWTEGKLADDLRDHPVVGVDYYDALAYAQWRGKDLPFEDEWERAARGTDGRVYPWGNDQELSGANTARVGLKMTVPRDLHPENVSPDGVHDMVGNVWELTHSPAAGGGVVVRGGSWYDFALYAKTFFRFASRPDARNGTIGFRCVRRDEERTDAKREVALEQAEAEIAARRGSQPPVDASVWSVEKRDFVPDLPRLRTYVAEARAEVLLGAKAKDKHAAPPPAITFTPPPEPEPAPEPEPESVTEPEPEPTAATPESESEPERESAPTSVSEPGAEPEPEPEPESVTEVDTEPEPDPAAEAERLHVLDRRGAPPPPPRRLDQPPRHGAAVQVPARSLPGWLWGLLAVGLLLFGGLVVMLVNRGGEEPPPVTPVVQDDGPRPQVPNRVDELPPALRYEEFPGANEPARVIDAADEKAAASLRSGVWLLLFADPATVEGAQTIQAAHELHRRIAPEGVRVGVVLPREPYELGRGELIPADQLEVALKTDGGDWLHDAIHVVLDPATGKLDERGRLHERYASAAVPVTAVLIRAGATERRTTPAEGGFTLNSLVGIALKALKLAGE